MKKTIIFLVTALLSLKTFSQSFEIDYNDADTAIQYAWEAMACREAYDEAFTIFQELSYKGYHKAQYWLAHMYALGEGRREDFKQAKFWYEKSASRGNADAMRELGAMYACPEDYGYIVTKNTEKAKEWYNKSLAAYIAEAQKGDSESQYKLGSIFYSGSFYIDDEPVIKEDFAKSFYWHSKASEQEHPVSLIELAAMYDNGDGATKDSQKAKKLYAKAISVLEKSAKNGNMYHQRLLGDCYSEPLFGELQNKEKALYWYRKAAAQGNILAKKTLEEYGEYEDFDFYTSESEQKITSKTLYQTGIYGQTFELTEYTNGSKRQLLLFMSDNATKITDTYDSSMPTVYYIWSKWFSNPSEYSKAVERCKTFFDVDMNLIYLAEMKDICDIASCCTSKEYSVKITKNGQKYIFIEYDCSDLDLLFEIARFYNQKGRDYVLQKYVK